MSSMLLAAAAAATAPGPTITAEQALANARALYAVERERPAACPDAQGDEIVVCARREDPDKLRVPSDADLGDTDDGVPRAPNVSGLPDCSRGCMRIGKDPPNPLIIDLNSIPEPPPGSDAERIARGEMAAP